MFCIWAKVFLIIFLMSFHFAEEKKTCKICLISSSNKLYKKRMGNMQQLSLGY